MKKEHVYAQALRWVADGEYVEAKLKLGQFWGMRFPHDFSPEFLQQMMKGGEQLHDYEFRIKPRTITVNGREVQAGETVAPTGDYFVTALHVSTYVSAETWKGEDFDKLCLERGLVHLTKEAAIAHAKAMLNID